MASWDAEMQLPQHGPIILSSSSTDVLQGTGKRCHNVVTSSSCCGAWAGLFQFVDHEIVCQSPIFQFCFNVLMERFEISLRHVNEATGEMTAGCWHRGAGGRAHNSSIGSLLFTRTFPALLLTVFFLPTVATFMAAREIFRLLFCTASIVVLWSTKNETTALKAIPTGAGGVFRENKFKSHETKYEQHNT
jgi:hypothetical protein